MPEELRNGFHLLRQGNIWIAIGPEFVDMKKSIVGFGGSPAHAVDDWKSRWSARPYCDGRHLKVSDFRVYESRDGTPAHRILQ
jgi:hypothetical protein